MFDEWKKTAFRAALRMIDGGPPKDLTARAHPEALDRGTTIGPADLAVILETATVDDPFLNALGMQVHKWDAAVDGDPWTNGTKPSTAQRRSAICEALGLDEAGGVALLAKRPIFHDATIVITAPWDHWYTPERETERAFYWPHYRDYLLNVRKWPGANVAALDLASTDVVKRVADPTRHEAFQSKGLVVGYVQSGKTANFTAVVAKAIDAGYRLIIVMTGTIEMLRGQTQRRIDMEMVGRQNILADFTPEQAIEAKVDYQDDDDWIAGRFVDLGANELETEIIRLTHHHKDYQKQFRALKIERFDMARPLFAPDNLFRTGARLVIVKKNATVLNKLVGDITANTKAFAEIPVLIIDDESDQASVNTVDPEKVRQAKADGREIKERRAINERIAEMLELMPRAQYVGYTATPFANVFCDPSDEQGIFPKDFLIGLQRPAGYMGVDDFHDLGDAVDNQLDPAQSNKAAFVRLLRAADNEPELQEEELARAIDVFVLAGAIKLYRKSLDPTLDFRHHTMLVHSSVRTAHQADIADCVKDLWARADYAHPSARSRLADLYRDDFVPVSTARLEPNIPALPDFDSVARFIGTAVGRITEHNLNPVIVVNSDKDIQHQQQALDFDRHSTWRILVGGAKLSRGFTVEGLTVTYFRRATNMNDSLTQMGRWFGFRFGYRDLVRLFIASSAKFGSKTVDLYEAFESVALDEAAFRAQLEQYAEWDGNTPRVRPSQIPPLVSQHLPWLRPTAKNKMFNAVLDQQSEQPFTPAGYTNNSKLLWKNLEVWRPILAKAQHSVSLPQRMHTGRYDAFVSLVPAAEIIDAIEHTHYLEHYLERNIRPKTNFYRRLVDEGLLDDFLVVVPQPDVKDARPIHGVGERSLISRKRRAGRGGKFGEFTEPKHRQALVDFVSIGGAVAELADWTGSRTGGLFLYLATESDPSYDDTPSKSETKDAEFGIVAAFSAYAPEAALAAHGTVLTFRVVDDRQPEMVAIPIDDH